MSQPNDPFDLVGTVLANKYRVDAVVGEGGFGVVYRGFHLSFKQPIAVKCLKIPPHFTPDAQVLFVDKFREEGQHLATLSSAHFSVVRVFDFDVASSPRGGVMPYLVLEWLTGRSLETVLEERRPAGLPFGEREAVALIRPAVEALAVAHRMGIAHRDIKPPNLFVVEGPATATTMKLLDFGIAKAMQEGETATRIATRTSSGFSAFSPQYGAPEQFSAKKYGATGPWTDVHGLGLVLVEMVTGRAPYGEDADQSECLFAAAGETRPTPRTKGVAVSDAFEGLCARALARMPKERFASARELLEAMDGTAIVATSLRGTPAVPLLGNATTVLPQGGAPVAQHSPVAQPAPESEPARSGTVNVPRPSTVVLAGGVPGPRIPTPVPRQPWEAPDAAGRARTGKLFVGVAIGLAAMIGLAAVAVQGTTGATGGGRVKISRVVTPKSATQVADALRLLDARNFEAAHFKLLEIPDEDRPIDNPDFKKVEAAWADWKFEAVGTAADLPKKKALLKEIASTDTVDAKQRTRASEMIRDIEAKEPPPDDATRVTGGTFNSPSGTPTPKTADPIAAPTMAAGAPALSEEAQMRRQLEPRVWSGRGSVDDIRMLKAICSHMGDHACRARAAEMLKKKEQE
jgi:serine/threonine protein kinase